MSTASGIISKIESIAGDSALPEHGPAEHTIDGITPELMVAPQSEEQVSEVVRLCSNGEVMLVPVGAEHHMFDVRRHDDHRPVVLISTKNLKQTIAYSHEDLTLTVGSGMTLAELDELARPYHQHLPIDPPHGQTATLGGVIACNATGPRSRLHGAISHYLTGGSMVLADGARVKSGAQTVKNVAGYDLHKLFIGSFGSLGIITRVALRLKAVPDDFRMAEVPAETVSQAESMLVQLLRGQTRPCLITLFNSLAAKDLGRDLPSGHMLLRMGYEGTTESVEWQLSQLQADSGDRTTTFDAKTTPEEFKKMVEWPGRAADFSFEAIIPAPRRQLLIEYCNERGIAVLAHAGQGVAYGHGQGELKLEIAASIRQAAGVGGSVKFIKLPAGSRVSRWGDVGQRGKWMRAVKENFDPHRIFPWPGFLGTGFSE